jgi:pantoate--beta-alanine ligase
MSSLTTIPARPETDAAVLRAKSALREALAEPRRAGRSIGLVPTMGCLHEGHLSLLRAARAECDVVVVSLFVNPTQFGPGEDFERYPRDERRDAELAAEAGADLVWAPPVEEVYLDGFATAVDVGPLAEVLCGDPARRGPEHFRGVATVVAKLFNAVQPDIAYFGRKDAQQVAVIRRMARDLDFPVRIEALPIVREPDGLAMSSRNAYLAPADRQRASALWRALQAVEREARAGSLAAGLEAGRRELIAAGIEPEYLEARDPDELTPVTELSGRPVLVAVAAQVGNARLIDNTVIHPLPADGPKSQPRVDFSARRARNRRERGANLMQRQMLKSKIHRATVTDCDVDYIGSITVDTELMASADLITNEQVHVWDIDNGARFVTYAIDGEPGSGTMQVNGAAAHLTRPGHKIIVASFGAYDERDLDSYSPVVVHVGEDNEIVAVDSHPEVLLAGEAGTVR